MKKEREIIEEIINSAAPDMREMLKSVYSFCSSLFLAGYERLLERILFAFSIVDRSFFVKEDPYVDAALHIGRGQTISQPSTVAAMLLYANIQEQDRVLEIGSGSGWNAAILSYLVSPGDVVSIERYLSLIEQAKRNVRALKLDIRKSNPQESGKMKIHFSAEDILRRGSVWKKKYNKIIFTAGINGGQEKKIEEIAGKLLLDEGVMVCPRVSGPMLIFKKDEKLYRYETKEHYMFVPLKEGIEE